MVLVALAPKRLHRFAHAPLLGDDLIETLNELRDVRHAHTLSTTDRASTPQCHLIRMRGGCSTPAKIFASARASTRAIGRSLSVDRGGTNTARWTRL